MLSNLYRRISIWWGEQLHRRHKRRHILLSDQDMIRIMTHHPAAFTWHTQRRKRLKLGEYS